MSTYCAQQYSDMLTVNADSSKIIQTRKLLFVTYLTISITLVFAQILEHVGGGVFLLVNHVVNNFLEDLLGCWFYA